MRRAPVALLSTLLLTASSAAAQDPLAQAEEARLGALVDALDADLERLQSAECEVACAALDSMRRSAEEICALDPGDRCASSRDKVAAATERVRERCPECDLGEGEDEPLEDETGGDAAVDVDRTEEDDRTEKERALTEAAAPMPASAPEERPGAGCAACAASGRSSSTPGWLAFVALAGAFVLRRRR